jgi:hypothetical protein
MCKRITRIFFRIAAAARRRPRRGQAAALARPNRVASARSGEVDTGSPIENMRHSKL